MLTIIDTLIEYLVSLRMRIVEHRERERFIRQHYKDIENAEEFWDKYH